MDDFDLKGLYQTVPQVVHERLSSVVEEQKNMEDRKKNIGGRKIYKRVLVVSLAAVMVLGTVVAADEIFHLNVKKQGYQTEIIGETENGFDDTFEDNEYIALKFGYLPEGFSSDNQTENIYADPEEVPDGRIKFHDGGGNSISPAIMKMGESNVLAQVKSTDNVKEYTADGKKIYIIEQINTDPAEAKSFDKQCYVFFDNCNYYVFAAMTTEISVEEAEKILENCTLQGVDEPYIHGIYVRAKKDIGSWRKDEIESAPNGIVEPDMEYLFSSFKKPGETAEYNNGLNEFSLTLNSYEYIDNINDFPDRDKFIDDFKEEWFDADGRILPRHIQLVRPGDGVNSVNEIIGERDVPVKLLVVNFTMEVKKKYGSSDGMVVAPRLYLDGKEPKPEGFYEQGDNRSSEGMPIYNDICIDNVKGILFADLKEGDVVTYNVIYVVDEEDMKHVGLVLHPINTALSFDLRGEK